MAKPRSMQQIKFPFPFEKNGRSGRVYKCRSGIFKTHFQFAGKARQNTFKDFPTAYAFLDAEFSKLDTDSANSQSLNPLNSDLRTYRELEQLLRERGDGATLRDAVQYFLLNHRTKNLEPKTFADCETSFLLAKQGANISDDQIKTLKKHFKRFSEEFGNRPIHEIKSMDIETWLNSQKIRSTKIPWSAKTRKSVRGSLISLSLYAQRKLSAIPEGKTQFQEVDAPKPDAKKAVEIYTPTEIIKLLNVAVSTDIELVPGVIFGSFCGLRPYEFHGERRKRDPLCWESINWHDECLHVEGQKVRSNPTRDVPLHRNVIAWLRPFKKCVGAIWPLRKAYEDRMHNLRAKAAVPSIYDGFRHSYASYRFREIKDLAQLASEMGNSPREIVNSYKRNVTDADAAAWFNVMPPPNYAEQIKTFLLSRKSV